MTIYKQSDKSILVNHNEHSAWKKGLLILLYWTSDSDRFYNINLVCPSVCNTIDLRNRSKDFFETWHEVGGNKGKNDSRALFEKNSQFAHIWPNLLKKKCPFCPKIAVFGTLQKMPSTNFLKLH